MTGEDSSARMLAAISEALALVSEYQGEVTAGDLSEPLPSLLEQCEQFLQEATRPEPVRLLHHLACTGGTIIARSLAVQPNTVLLSEIDPLSLMQVDPRKPGFAPTDLLRNLRHALRPVGDAVLTDVFMAGLTCLHDHLTTQGLRLVLRDHAHSQFCTWVDPDARPTLRDLVMARTPVRSLVTVRHPLDSFLSLRRNGWLAHFSPPTLEEYARRYRMFLDRHRDVPVIRYEDFTADPEPVLRQMCDSLDLPFLPGSIDLIPVVTLSGDSGRRGDAIAPRPRRQIDAGIAAELEAAPGYVALCAEMGYDPAA
jgi:hypothetical protein